MITISQKTAVIAACVIAALVVLIGYQWHRDSVTTASATAFQQASEQAAKQIDQRLEQRERQWRADRQQLLDLIAATPRQTPAQTVATQTKYVELPKPIIIAGPNTESAKIGDAIVPQESVNPLFTELAQGKLCAKDLAKCQADRADIEFKLEMKTAEAQKWEQASKGGSAFKRVTSTALKFGIGFGIGYLAHR